MPFRKRIAGALDTGASPAVPPAVSSLTQFQREALELMLCGMVLAGGYPLNWRRGARLIDNIDAMNADLLLGPAVRKALTVVTGKATS